jgi:hypothetical protein
MYKSPSAGRNFGRQYNLAQNSGGTVSGRIENLTPWQKGTSGNPGGRPKKRMLDEVLAEMLQDGEGEATTAIAVALLSKAKQGDLRVCQFIAERTQGKPQQKIGVDVGFNMTLSERMQIAQERVKRHHAEEMESPSALSSNSDHSRQ